MNQTAETTSASENTVESFDELDLSPVMRRALKKAGFSTPSPIQAQLWPMAMRGIDVVGISQTGSGKTLAFLLPMFVHILKQKTPISERKGPSALIISPTRELALQIAEEINKY